MTQCILDLGGSSQSAHRLSERYRFIESYASDKLSYLCDRMDIHAQFANSQTDQQRQVEWRTGDLAADRRGDARILCSRSDCLDRADDGRVKRLIPLRDRLVIAVYC